MLAWIARKWGKLMERGTYPDDFHERLRIKAFILGAGVPVSKPGPVKVEVEDGHCK